MWVWVWVGVFVCVCVWVGVGVGVGGKILPSQCIFQWMYCKECCQTVGAWMCCHSFK